MAFLAAIGAVAAGVGALKQRLLWFVISAVACLPMIAYFLLVPRPIFRAQGLLLLLLSIVGIIAVRLGKPRLSQLIGLLLAINCGGWSVFMMLDRW